MRSKRKKRSIAFQLARYGSFSNGILYAMLGVIALLSLLRLKDGGSDESSILEFLNTIPAGSIVIWIILAGMLCYVVWRIYESITDPYKYGGHPKGIVKRIGVALSSIADGLIGYSAVKVLLGIEVAKVDGQPVAERMMVSKLFEWTAGEWIVALIGLIISVTAFLQFVYVIGKDYEDRLDIKHINVTKKKIIHVLAWSGHFARGVILLIVGFFMVKSAVLSDPQQLVNTDKAFNFLGEQVGHPVYALVAFGTICYGFFMFAMAWYYDFD